MATLGAGPRVLVGLVLGLGTLTSCASTSSDVGGAEASCPLALVRQGEAYFASDAPPGLELGRSIDSVTSGSCDDGNGADPSRPVHGARAVRGIDPDQAFVVPEWPEHVFVVGPPGRLTYPHRVAQLLGLPERADTATDRGRRALVRSFVDRVLDRPSDPLPVAEEVEVHADGESASLGDGSADMPHTWRSHDVARDVVQTLRTVGGADLARGIAGVRLATSGDFSCGRHELPPQLAGRPSVSFDADTDADADTDTDPGPPAADGIDPTCARLDLYLTDGVIDAVALRTTRDLASHP